MTEAQVLALIQSVVIANGNNEITANILRPVLEAILAQPNDEIGDLTTLDTTNKDDLVSAINEIFSLIGSDVTILTGTTDPNITPPSGVNIGDFYMWDDGVLKGFFQYNGVDFVLIKNIDIATDLISLDPGNNLTLGSDEKMFVNSSSSIPIENVYPDVFTAFTGLLDNQLDQTTGFIQKVLDASADPNVTIPAGESTVRYYEKLEASTAVLANYELLNAQQSAALNGDIAFNQFTVDAIQLGAISDVTSGTVKIRWEDVDDTITEIHLPQSWNGFLSNMSTILGLGNVIFGLRIYNKTAGLFSSEQQISFSGITQTWAIITSGKDIPILGFKVGDIIEIEFGIYEVDGGVAWNEITGDQDDINLIGFTDGEGLTTADFVARSAAEANAWLSVAYGNGVFVAVAASGTNQVMTSSDNGVTWVARTAAEVNVWGSVAYGNGVFVAVSQNGTNQVMTSSDNGETWVARAAAEDNSWQSVAYGNGVFFAVAFGTSQNQVMTSSDNGVTWVARTASEVNPWRSVTFGNGVFVAVAFSGTNRVMTATLTPPRKFENTVNEYQLNGVTVSPVSKVLNINTRLKEYTVATLPDGINGDTAYVTDADAPTYLGTLTGGGSVVCPVFYNGTLWICH